MSSQINSATYDAYAQLTTFEPLQLTQYALAPMVSAQTFIGDDPTDTTPSNGSSSEEIFEFTTELDGEQLFWENPNNPALNGIATYTGYVLDGYPIITAADGNKYVLFNGTQPPAPLSMDQYFYAYCFLAGTRIATPSGERRVQDLQVGDLVTTAGGEVVRAKWIGRQTINPLFAKFHDQLPVRIGAGALGDGLPTRDLFVTPDHAILVDDVLVHASALINGRTIMQMKIWPRDLEYYHVETDAHELILAEGAPAETFIDNVSRERFDNHAEYVALYPDAQPMTELEIPRVKFARQLPRAIAERLDAVADALLGKQAIAA